MSHTFRHIVAGFFFVVFISGAVMRTAQAGAPLAEQMPDDAIIYIGWAGTTTPVEGYAQSHTKALIEQSDFKALLTQLWPQVVQKIGMDNRHDAEDAEMVEKLLEMTLSYPTALYFGGMDGQRGEPRLALICDAGDEQHAGDLAERVTKVLGPAEEFVIQKQGVRVIVQTPSVGKAFSELANGGLAGSAAFKSAMAETGATAKAPLVAVYFDVPKLVAMIDNIAGEGADGQEWAKVRDSLHLNDIRQLAMTAGFDGGDWVCGAYFGVTESQQGLMRMVARKPVDESLLRLVPGSSAMAGAGRFDLLELYDFAHQLLGEMDADAQRNFDQSLEQFNKQMGVNLREDVFGAMGDQWVWYTDRNVGGAGMLGIAMVNPLRNPAKFEQALPKLVTMANMMLMSMIGDEDVHVSIRSMQAEGTTVYYLAIPGVAPSLAIKDGKLYAGLQPQTVVGAMQDASARAGIAGGSLLDNAAFVKLHGQCGGKAISSFEYYDLPQTFDSGYQITLMMMRIYLGMGDMFGLQTPAMLLPPAGKVLPHIAPAGAFTWSDGSGWHMQSRSPFPGSTLVATQQNLMVSQYAMSLGILLPAMGRSRQIANRAVSGANLRGLTQGCLIYAVSNNDQFPADLSVLVVNGDATASTVMHPLDRDRKRTFPAVPLSDPKVAQWVKDNTSYVYLGGNANMGSDDIVMYEKPDPRWAKEGINIAFGDAHVAWVPWSDVPELFKRAGKTPPTPPVQPKRGGVFQGRSAAPVRRVAQSWYCDTVTGDYFLAAADQFPPITSPKGNSAVRAHFFSCSSCDQKGERFVGFYDKFTDEAKKKLEAARDNPNTNAEDAAGMEMYYENGMLYSIDGKTWYPPSNTQYQEALQKKLNCPNGSHARYCLAK